MDLPRRVSRGVVPEHLEHEVGADQQARGASRAARHAARDSGTPCGSSPSDIVSTRGGHAGMQSSQPLQRPTSIVTVPRDCARERRRSSCRHPRVVRRPREALVRQRGPSPREVFARSRPRAESGTKGSTLASPRRARRDPRDRCGRRTRRPSPSTRPAGCRGLGRDLRGRDPVHGDGRGDRVVERRVVHEHHRRLRGDGARGEPSARRASRSPTRCATTTGGVVIGPSATTTVLSVGPPRIMPP